MDGVIGPETYALYRRRNDGLEIAIFGDNHQVMHGTAGVPVSEYIQRSLHAKEGLHVYAEIPPPLPGFKTAPGSANKELQKVRQAQKHHRFAGRIHNIDFRDTIDTRNLQQIATHVRAYVMSKGIDTETQTLMMEQEELNSQLLQEIHELRQDLKAKTPLHLLPVIPIGKERAKYLAEIHSLSSDVSDAEEVFLNQALDPVIEADIIHIIKYNPDRAESILFFIGDKHREVVQKHYLQTEIARGRLECLYNSTVLNTLLNTVTDDTIKRLEEIMQRPLTDEEKSSSELAELIMELHHYNA